MMTQRVLQWLRKKYIKIINSIAFIPALIAVGFLIMAILMMELDESGAGFNINKKIEWLRLNDVETARTVVATVAAGIISLTVFNFSIFMVVLNQAASQMSNRMLDNMIGDRFQKLLLSSYIGTIVYGLFLLTSISEGKETKYIPALSIYLLLLLTIFDIFLFIFFLHYVTQAFRYEQLIQRIHGKTKAKLYKQQKDNNKVAESVYKGGTEVNAPESGYFQHFNQEQLTRIADRQDITIRFLHPTGAFILKNTPFMEIGNSGNMSERDIDSLFSEIDFFHGQQININAYYGFQHLMEVGVKALSPGINDPGTAVLSLHALTDLLAYRLKHPRHAVGTGQNGTPRIFSIERSVQEIFVTSVLPIWHYGKNDQQVQTALLHMIKQLQIIDTNEELTAALNKLAQEIKLQATE